MSKAAIVREMFLKGEMTNSPEDKKRVAALLGMTVQTVHATLVKMNGRTNLPLPSPVIHDPVVPHNDIRKMLEDKFNQCYEIVEKKGISLQKINVDFSLRGAVAGMFVRRYDFVNGTKKYFRINLELAKNNLQDFLDETIPHEFCHYIVAAKYGKVSPHGWEWKNAMRMFFGLAPRRCHSYDLSQISNKKVFHYKCNCREKILLGATRHRKMQMNNKRYHCTLCKSLLEFVG